MDLRAQLQAHLGNAFVLERELGGGGMSRVFVANEVRLSRKLSGDDAAAVVFAEHRFAELEAKVQAKR